MSNVPKLSGGCQCGNVRYRFNTAPGKVSYCDCPTCRKFTGGPTNVVAMVDDPGLEYIRGEPEIYHSSPGITRKFCKQCGTPLSWHGIWHDRAQSMIYVGTLDDPELIKPDRHAFVEYRLKFFDTDDALSRFEQSSPDGSRSA